MFGYMKLIRNWLKEEFFTPVHEYNYNVHVSLGEEKESSNKQTEFETLSFFKAILCQKKD